MFKNYFIIAILLVSCSSKRTYEENQRDEIDLMEEIYYYQGLYSDDKIDELTLKPKPIFEIKDNNFSSFQTLYFFDKIRRNNKLKILDLFDSSKIVYSIEFKRGLKIHFFYWTETDSLFITCSEMILCEEKELKEDFLYNFELLKKQMENGSLELAMTSYKESFYTPVFGQLIISKYSRNVGEQEWDMEFSMW